ETTDALQILKGIEEGQAYLHNLHINPYKQASYLNEEPERPRKLLLHKREILKIDTKMRERNLTLVPTKIYFTARGLVKVEIVFGQGKKRYDKRADIKKRETDMGLKRILKKRRG
ncbi:MAG TPA: SsrA-binding protein, partial [Candidatus Omnitrophota bacterium]|nr:SsrA-binding protein [Candidatus Omnitrophota bacterium]